MTALGRNESSSAAYDAPLLSAKHVAGDVSILHPYVLLPVFTLSSDPAAFEVPTVSVGPVILNRNLGGFWAIVTVCETPV